MAAEIPARRSTAYRRLHASMRPRRMAAEIDALDLERSAAYLASMRPRRMAAEITVHPEDPTLTMPLQ